MAAKQKRTQGAYEQVTPEKKAFGARLKEAREIADMTLTEAAVALGYSQPVQLSLMESGARMPTLRIIVACAKLYGTTTDFLAGLADDGDRDPAVALQRHVASRVTSEVQHLIAVMARTSVQTVRELMPSVSDGQRLASLTLEAKTALDTFRRLNPKFDTSMRAGSNLALKLDQASGAATIYAARVDRAKRLMVAKIGRDGDAPEQMSVLPVLDLFGA